MCRAFKINSRIWNDSQFSSLSDKAKLAYFLIATHPHLTAIGAMRGTVPGLAAELGWSLKAFQKAFQELVYLGLVRCSAKAPLIWLPHFLKDNRPESPNVVKSWGSIVEELPECRELVDVLLGVKAFADGWGEAFWLALPEVIYRVIPIKTPHKPEASAGETTPPAVAPVVSPAPEPASKPADAPPPLADAVRPLVVLPIPGTLRTEKFLDAWSKWTAHCRDHNLDFNDDFAEHQLHQMSHLGVDRSIEAIEDLLLDSTARINGSPKPQAPEPALSVAT